MEKLVETLARLLMPSGCGVVGLTGGGGKTSALRILGKYMRDSGKSVLLTTTTKIQAPKTYDFETDHVFIDEESVLQHEARKGESVFFAQRHIMDPKKMVSPRHEILSLLIPRYDVVLIEADGSKQLPLKYHSERDPVMLDEMDATLAIAGSSAWGDSVDNTCFGFDSQAKVDSTFINFLISDSQGLLKGARGRVVLLFNQADASAMTLDGIRTDVPTILGSLKEDMIHDTRNI